MKKHANQGTVGVLGGQHRRGTLGEVLENLLPVYDATVFVGLKTIVYNAAIERTDDDGELTIELPKMDELVAAAAVERCLMDIKLRGPEVKTMRHIMKMTLTDLAQRLDGKTAPETVSRWESEAQPMGGYAEKVFRLVVCEEMKARAPGIEYNASMIANLKVRDPWKMDPAYETPPVELELIHLKEQRSGSITEAWNAKKA
jgi:DNA-binding transcriptional regulator YiaG